ncbi:hypothetical protein Tco_1381492 [Tanacetum coccineum]
MILSPGHPIPHGRPYRYHPNGPIHMMTASKRVGPFLVPQLAVGHPVDHSSSDYFSPDDSARYSSSDSSSEASSYFHSDASSDSSSGHSLSDHSSLNLPTLSPVRADLIPSPKKVKDSGYLTDVEVDPREISLRDDAIVRMLLGNRGNGNGGNGENRNGNRNGNHGMNYGGFMPVARGCTFQDFLKCKPQNFSGTEGVAGLTPWFEKMETVFNISNCPLKYQVKYATCTLQDSALMLV